MLSLALGDQLLVLLGGELKELTVRAVGVAIGVGGHRVRGVVLFRGQQLAVVTLLELRDVGLADMGGHTDQFLGDFHVAFVVASDFGDDLDGRFGLAHKDGIQLSFRGKPDRMRPSWQGDK